MHWGAVVPNEQCAPLEYSDSLTEVQRTGERASARDCRRDRPSKFHLIGTTQHNNASSVSSYELVCYGNIPLGGPSLHAAEPLAARMQRDEAAAQAVSQGARDSVTIRLRTGQDRRSS
jgi:hypothetical protein